MTRSTYLNITYCLVVVVVVVVVFVCLFVFLVLSSIQFFYRCKLHSSGFFKTFLYKSLKHTSDLHQRQIAVQTKKEKKPV